MTTLVVRHTVTDYDAWKQVFDGHAEVRRGHGSTGQRLLRDGNEVLALIEFPNPTSAQAFRSDPTLKEVMSNAGVIGAPDIHVWTDAEESR